MLDAIRAESLKLRRHRATWLMVWIFPIAFGLIVVAQLLWDFTHASNPAAQAATAGLWLQQSTTAWKVPQQGGGRLLIGGFAALVFAGEYGWNTWKLVVPACTRWRLIAAKWIVAFAFVFCAFLAADLLAILGSAVRSVLGGPQIPAGATLAAIVDTHATAAAEALIPILYTIAWAGLFAVLTTSLLASVVLSIGLVLLEQLVLMLGMIAYAYAPSLTSTLLHLLPFYHMANLAAWAKGSGLTVPLGPGADLATSWLISLVVVGAWIAAAGAATLIRFARQDIN